MFLIIPDLGYMPFEKTTTYIFTRFLPQIMLTLYFRVLINLIWKQFFSSQLKLLQNGKLFQIQIQLNNRQKDCGNFRQQNQLVHTYFVLTQGIGINTFHIKKIIKVFKLTFTVGLVQWIAYISTKYIYILKSNANGILKILNFGFEYFEKLFDLPFPFEKYD